MSIWIGIYTHRFGTDVLFVEKDGVCPTIEEFTKAHDDVSWELNREDEWLEIGLVPEGHEVPKIKEK